MDRAPIASQRAVERLKSAFSLRRNLRRLFVPTPGHLRPLDGIRALSVLWVVLFHAGWYSLVFIPRRTYIALLDAPWMLPFWRGDFGVDVFFVLSGFLIAGMLIDERRQTGRVRLGIFYARRLLRLWPALAVAVVINILVIGDNPSMAWANLLFVSNFIPVTEGCMGWTWSLAIEEQFYLVCPWLLRAVDRQRTGVRVAVVAGVAAALAVVIAVVVDRGDFLAIDSEIVINRDPLRWARAFDALYTKPWMRAGPLLAGVGAAVIYRAPGAMAAIARAPVVAWIGLMVALGAAATSMHWPLVARAPRWVEVVFLAGFRTVFGVSVAYVILLSLSENRVGRALGALLSSRILRPFAELAYSAYLLNPILAGLVHGAIAPRLALDTQPMALFMPIDLVVTFVAATGLYLLVERPLMELRPRAKRVEATAG